MTMTSRERLTAALRRQPVDRIPCCPAFSTSLTGPQHHWRGRADTLDRITGDLGLDATISVDLPASWHPDITARVWRDDSGAEPVLHKRIETPAGPLTAAIRMTADLEHPDDIPLNSDWNVSRYVKPWLETEQDVECYRYVQLPPETEDIAAAHQRFLARKQLADQYGLATFAACGMGLTSALQLFGPQQAVLLSIQQPALIERFLQIEHQATMRRAQVLAQWGVDIVCRNGFYETTDFWSPNQVRRWMVPLLRDEIAAMRSHGAATTYTVCTGIMPILDILADLPFDNYNAIEPALGNQDMDRVAEALCPNHSIWGGVSGPIHIGEGTPGQARQAVRGAVRRFGPRGLILSAVPSIRPHWPWENVLAMLDEWRRICAELEPEP